MWYVSTHTYVVSENIPFSNRIHLILLMSAFLIKNSTFAQENIVRAVWENFQFL